MKYTPTSIRNRRRITVAFNLPETLPVWLNEQTLKGLPNSQWDETAAHAARAEIVGNDARAEIGRVRAGKQDTGEEMIQLDGGIDLSFIRLGIINNNLRLRKVWKQKRERGWKVRLDFSQGDPVELTRPENEMLAALGGQCWGQVHIWSNPDNTVTINTSGGTTNKAKYELRVQNGDLTVPNFSNPTPPVFLPNPVLPPPTIAVPA